ncbi:MAG: DNRLRE domain-containing protein [Deltaproteobacteria bacterium]|nr:DNRLRE domain-containing protein [Deltaproteobacteria bacterium]
MRTFAAVACLASLVVISATSSRASAQLHVEDSLRDGTMGNASGGTFGPDGWTVTGVSDHIWYALPTLVRGSIEVTVTNVSNANLPLADHEILAMYEAGYGISEPIRYAPEFRVNHYKTLVRIYGTAEPERTGAMKLMWGICPSGAPGYDACGCASFFEEPFAGAEAWTGAPRRLRIEWGDGRSRLLRDGIEIVSVDYDGFVFAPSVLHFMLGSPRNDGGLSAMPIGATFSDLVIEGVEGATATCPTTELPDAGPVADAGMCSDLVVATADGTAASFEPGVFPDANDLNVEGDGTGPQAVVYVRFPPVAGPVARATLTMTTSTVPSAGGGSGIVCEVTSGSWDEASLTWATRPTVGSRCSGEPRAVGPDTIVRWDVTPLVAPGGDVELAIVSNDVDGAHYLSRESGACTGAPRLEVELAPPSDAGTAELDASSADLDTGVAPMDARTSGTDAGGRGITTGCSCRMTRIASRGATHVAAMVLLVSLVASRRRRR